MSPVLESEAKNALAQHLGICTLSLNDLYLTDVTESVLTVRMQCGQAISHRSLAHRSTHSILSRS